MYPSGEWRGFWQQDGFGRQPMEQFELTFNNGTITGRGSDIVGPFVIRGECDPAGRVCFVKQYVGRHAVDYVGEPDGEGSILGTWHIDKNQFGFDYRGPFLLKPVTRRTHADVPITVLKPKVSG